MFFNSLEYLIFFPLVLILYFSLPFKLRTPLLLIASYFFYMYWKVEYITLILLSTFIDYFVARKIDTAKSDRYKKNYLYISLFTNLSLLFFFKYFNFFNTSLHELFTEFGFNYTIQNIEMALPIGISFYTFQTMSYTLDVYRGVAPVEKNFGVFALFVSYFPQLVAGPIERPGHLIKQLKMKFDFSTSRLCEGLRLISIGLFKKVVIADNIAVFVNEVYNNYGSYNGLMVVLATYFFAYQVYCDFSGYTDIARGSALIMGVDLIENFKRPFFSKSIREFWTRWHLSLTNWFHDYVFLPLVFNRKLGGAKFVDLRMFLGIIMVFLISGLWHGANWTFVVWGGLHGLYMMIEMVWEKLSNKNKSIKNINIPKLFKIFITFNLVCFTFIFFRAESLTHAFNMIEQISKFSPEFIFTVTFYGKFLMAFSVFSIILMLVYEYMEEKHDVINKITSLNVLIRWPLYYAFLFMMIIFGANTDQAFIYFQF